MQRLEDERLLTGCGAFTDDIANPGALWAAFVRSPYAHAEIIAVDPAAALALPGACLVLTGEDLASAGIKPIPITQRLTDKAGRPPRPAAWPALALGRVRHAGEGIAICVAQTHAVAIAMTEAITVNYRGLPAVTDVRDALLSGAPELCPDAPGNIAFEWTLGDAAAAAQAFAAATHIVGIERVSQRVIICPMEPRAAIANYDIATRTYHLHTGNQGMVILRDHVAEMLAVDKHRVVVTSRDVGGGFGIRSGTYPEYPVLLLAAKQLGKSVRWTATRSEAFVSDAQARDSRMAGRLALDGEGRILALEARSTAALGAYVHPVGYFIACANFARCLTGPYRVPALDARITCVLTNTVPTAPYRGAGRPEAAYLTEGLMEAAARHLDLDALEIRRRNLVRPEAMPYKTAAGTLYDSGDFPRLLQSATAAAGWAGSGSRKQEAKARGRLRGIGIGLFVEISGGVPNERAKMRLAPDGRIHVRTTLGATGQGHETVFGLIAAAQLGLPPDRIVVEQGDSTGFEDGGGSSASRSTTMGGLAIRATAIALIATARAHAAERLQVAAEKLVYEDGRFTVPGSNLAIGFDDLARDSKVPLAAEMRIEADPTFPNGCHIAEVEIDPDTGRIEIVNYVAVDDCGRIIAHELAEGQVHGALAQGIGQVLLEHGVYDRESGQLLTGSFMDYGMPRADDLPRFTSVLQPTPARSNALGVKGLGESGTVGALPAVTGAIVDALAPLGVTEIEMPATPYRVWQTIQRALAGRQGAAASWPADDL